LGLPDLRESLEAQYRASRKDERGKRLPGLPPPLLERRCRSHGRSDVAGQSVAPLLNKDRPHDPSAQQRTDNETSDEGQERARRSRRTRGGLRRRGRQRRGSWQGRLRRRDWWGRWGFRNGRIRLNWRDRRKGRSREDAGPLRAARHLKRLPAARAVDPCARLLLRRRDRRFAVRAGKAHHGATPFLCHAFPCLSAWQGKKTCLTQAALPRQEKFLDDRLAHR